MTGTLFIVATPIGNLDDITFRAFEVLKNVDFVLAEDTRHSKKLLSHLDISKPIRAFHEHNEREKTKAIISEIYSGKSIALISDAGTPLISDPGYFLVAQAKKEEALAKKCTDRRVAAYLDQLDGTNNDDIKLEYSSDLFREFGIRFE